MNIGDMKFHSSYMIPPFGCFRSGAAICCAFNAFFVEKGAIKTAEAYADDLLVERFLEMGTEDIDKLLACCEEYGHPCPNELRLIYDTRVGRFDVKYQYQPVLEMEDLSFSGLFTSWISEKKEEMRN